MWEVPFLIKATDPEIGHMFPEDHTLAGSDVVRYEEGRTQLVSHCLYRLVLKGCEHFYPDHTESLRHLFDPIIEILERSEEDPIFWLRDEECYPSLTTNDLGISFHPHALQLIMPVTCEAKTFTMIFDIERQWLYIRTKEEFEYGIPRTPSNEYRYELHLPEDRASYASRIEAFVNST